MTSLAVGLAVAVIVIGGTVSGITWARHGQGPNTGTANITGLPSDSLQPSPNWSQLPVTAAHLLYPGQVPPEHLSMPWKLSSLGADGTSITVNYVGGDNYCVKPIGFLLTQTTRYVIIDAISAHTAGTTVCSGSFVVLRARLVLDAPLGKRALLHSIPARQWAKVAEGL